VPFFPRIWKKGSDALNVRLTGIHPFCPGGGTSPGVRCSDGKARYVTRVW